MPTPTDPAKPSFAKGRLAAIVFTDVAGFSGLVEKNERRTLLLVERDLKLFGEVFRRFGGDVLKNTGDGCLAAFPSVESAVGSAINIQRIMTDARKRFPPDEILHHRIGIHLGDVFFGPGDVLGNGVNIAARLMATAEPDGICISQTVFDLVKHKLAIKAVCIGAPELKNIREAVQVYRLVLQSVEEEQAKAAAAQRARARLAAVALAMLGLIGIAIPAIVLTRSRTPRSSSAATTSFTIPTTSTEPITGTNPTTATAADLLPIFQTVHQKPDYTIDSAASWKLFRSFTNNLLVTSIENDSYLMKIQATKLRVHVSPAPWGSFEDVTVQATGKIQGAPNSAWGLQLLSTEGSHKLVRAMIAASGLVKVDLTRAKGTDDNNIGLDPNNFFMVRDVSMHFGQDQNTVIVDIRNHQMTVLVNNQKVGMTWDITPLGPATLQLMVDGTQGTVGTFSQLSVWRKNP